MTETPLHLLLVEDDVLEARLLKANLDRRGAGRVEVAHSGDEALERLVSGEPVDAVLTDLVMPGMDGIELVRRARGTDPSLPVVILTAHGTLERAVEGIQAGATDFLPKPVNVDAVLALLERAVSERSLREELSARLERRDDALLDAIVGSAPALDRVREFARRIAGVRGARVLITGESGTGKSALARAIHDLSGVSGRFVEVNCGALSPSLLESELFGHEKGAFTDAKELKRGLIEVAHRGTLFLDEIGALPQDLQSKLLLFLESQEIRRVGGTKSIPIHTRVIAATNENLHRKVREGGFRLDLFYRLDVASVEMPPLREMPGVIPELARHFTRRACAELGRATPAVDGESFAPLLDYPWPGNARELRNAVERALIFHEQGALRVPAPSSDRQELLEVGEGILLEPGLTLEEVERRYLEATLARSPDRTLEEVAGELGISRKTLWEKRGRYEL